MPDSPKRIKSAKPRPAGLKRLRLSLHEEDIKDSAAKAAAVAGVADEDREFVREIYEQLFVAMRREAAIQKQHRSLVEKLSDLRTWRALEKSDRAIYRAELQSFLRECRSCLNQACKIQAHRQADEELRTAIKEIKDAHPDYSFGKVAHEYTRRTGKAMTRNRAERIYKRALVALPPQAEFPALADLPLASIIRH